MNNKDPRNNFSRRVLLEVLTEDGCEKIVNTAKEILAETGVKMEHEKVREMLKSAGCRVEGDHVWLPAKVIETAISTIPPTFDMYDREGNYAFTVGNGTAILGPANTNSHIIDSLTGERRETLREDAVKGAWVCDALPYISWASGMSQMTDVPQEIACVYESYEMIQNTSKPISTWALDCKTFQSMIDMYTVVRGSTKNMIEKPYVILLNNPTTPLVWDFDAAERMVMMVENGVVPAFGFELPMGSMAPATIPGTLVDILLASFVGAVIAQFTKPGSPFITGISIDTTCYNTGGVSDGCPERPLATSAVAALGRYLGIPVGSCGGCSDSPVFDQQASFEMATQIFTGVLSGLDMIGYAGFLEAHMGISLEALAFCNEVYSYAMKFAEGIVVNEDTLAKQVIEDVGEGSMFLAHEHTLSHCRELWRSDVIVQDYSFEKFKKDGYKDLNDRLNDKIREILEKGNQKPLEEDKKQKLDIIMKRVEDSIK